jgi:predicted proteasome-type protease
MCVQEKSSIKAQKGIFFFNVVCSRFEENSIIEIWEEKFGRKVVKKKVNCGLSLVLTITCALIHFC